MVFFEYKSGFLNYELFKFLNFLSMGSWSGNKNPYQLRRSSLVYLPQLTPVHPFG